MGKYIPDLATEGGPLYKLLKTKSLWAWDQAQKRAFIKLKNTLIKTPVLAHYDPAKKPSYQWMPAATELAVFYCKSAKEAGNQLYTLQEGCQTLR